jgi:hypothetical protein
VVDPAAKAADLAYTLLPNLNDLAGWVGEAPFAWGQE